MTQEGGAGARQFYGGEPITGNPVPSSGEISGGRYTGPEAHAQGPWKCPACSAENQGPIPQGCVACGSGKPGYHVGQPAAPAEDRSAHLTGFVEALNDGDPDPLYQVAYNWSTEHPDVTTTEAFVAGFKAARAQFLAHTMQAAPVTVDVATLAPHTKAQRTIIAALEIFKDQILNQAPEEILSGEWMSIPEVDALIATLKGQL